MDKQSIIKKPMF